jgi:hypothetical protein
MAGTAVMAGGALAMVRSEGHPHVATSMFRVGAKPGSRTVTCWHHSPPDTSDDFFFLPLEILFMATATACDALMYQVQTSKQYEIPDAFSPSPSTTHYCFFQPS